MEASAEDAPQKHRSVERARQAVSANPHWYHTLELAPGVLTPGYIDLRGTAAKVLPGIRELAGTRALDVGTFDGFWAFALEERGASEVLALDLPAIAAAELPPPQRERILRTAGEWDVELGRGFRLAAEVLGSRARRLECDVMAVDLQVLGGPVDHVFIGALLLHLRDPVLALERLRGVLRPGGTITLLESFSIRETVSSPRRAAATFRAAGSDFTWWIPNLAALRDWLTAAGFQEVARRGLHHPPARPEMRQWLAGYSARNPG